MSISKLLKITLSALLLAQTLIAQTVVNIPRGNSFTALLVFNSSYNPSRIDDISVWVGSKSWGTLEEGKVKTTANARQFRVEITSDETRNYTGRNEFIVSVKDSVLGVRKVIAGILNFTEAGRYSNAIINSGVDWTVNINVSEAGITSNATLATIFKGDTGATGANAVNPNFTAATGAAGSNVSITGTYPNLTLTVPRGDTGATGPAGSDASVTSSNINAALGYTPVSPAQLGAKSDTSHTHPITKITGLQTALDLKAASSHTHAQSDVTGLVAALGAKRDTSASITTAKISDWTAAWAARWATEAVAITSSLIPSGTRNLGGSSSGQHWNIFYVRAIVSESLILTMQGGASRIALDPNASSTSPKIQIGFNNVNTPNHLAKVGYATLISNNSNQYGWDVAPNINQSGTASYTVSRISPRIIASVGSNNRLFSVGYNNADYGTGVHTEVLGVDVSGMYVTGVSLFNTLINNGLGTAAQFNGTIYIDSKINQATGTNKALNTVTLSGGTATVNNTLVTANSIISLTYQNCSNCGTAYISAKTAGTSFVITSTNASDASIIAYEIKN